MKTIIRRGNKKKYGILGKVKKPIVENLLARLNSPYHTASLVVGFAGRIRT